MEKFQRVSIYLLLVINFFNCSNWFVQLTYAAETHFEEELPAPDKVDPHDVWNYEKQQNWFRAYPACASTRQSPINIDTSKVILNTNYQLRFENYSQDITFKLKNSHHTVNFDPMQLSNYPTLEPSWLPGKQFELHDIHFHWGNQVGECGSEHKVDNKFSPSEVHFVHFLKGFTKDEALLKQDSIVVIGVFIDEAISDLDFNYKPKFDEAISYFAQVSGKTKSQSFDLPLKFDPFTFLPTNKERFYAYSGSLTTPACSEVVNWVVMDEHVSISRESLEILINMKTSLANEVEHEIGSNHRELQQLDDREIIATFEPTRRLSIFKFPINTIRALFEGIKSSGLRRINPFRYEADIDS